MRNQVDRLGLNLKIGFVVGLTITLILFLHYIVFCPGKSSHLVGRIGHIEPHSKRTDIFISLAGF